MGTYRRYIPRSYNAEGRRNRVAEHTTALSRMDLCLRGEAEKARRGYAAASLALR
jgi:hypothetical protein